MNVDFDKKTTNIVVAGGGTAGWMTAIWVKNFYPEVKVTVIENSEIGTLGAGEGSTIQFFEYLNEVGIPFNELFKFANGTIKSGIKFTGWNELGESFMHSFAGIDDVNWNTQFSYNASKVPLIALEEISQGNNLDGFDISAQTANRNAVRFLPVPILKQKTDNPLTHFGKIGENAAHFDSILLGGYFKKFACNKRYVNSVDGEIKDILTDKDGYVSSVNLTDGSNLPVDFIFDCTGFNRKIIGDFYKTKFKSYKKSLPVNRAISFNVPIDFEKDDLPPYTEAVAMKYGWMWKIPLQNRMGCGYVFDSNYLTDEQAKKEIDEVTGRDNRIARTFSFEAGVYEKPWVKNCIAIGLAQGFVEPLEATSIWTIIDSLKLFNGFIHGATYRDENAINFYNDSINSTHEKIASFIYFHYITNRTDTPFWKNFVKNNKTPDIVKQLLENRDVSFLNYFVSKNMHNFAVPSWLQVGAGKKFFWKPEEVEKVFNSMLQGVKRNEYFRKKQQFMSNMTVVANSCIDHKSFLTFTSDYN